MKFHILLGLVGSMLSGELVLAQDAIQGSWTLVSGEAEGKALSKMETAGGKLVIKGNNYTVNIAGKETLKGSQKLGTSNGLKTIDIVDANGANEGKTCLGIYELKGDEFRCVFSQPGKPRPEKFSTAPESGQWMHVWKRAKGVTIQGSWILVSGEAEGKALSSSEIEGGKLVIKGNNYTVNIAGKEALKGSQKLGTSNGLKTIDIVDANGANEGKTCLGIYELKGDEFRCVFSQPGKPRPEKFSTAPESGQWMHVWKRAK